MEELEVQQELQDQLGNLSFSPPPMKKSDTRDSISSVDSDVSLSFDRRGSKGEDADLSDSGSSDSDRKTGNLHKKQNKNSDQDSGADSIDDIVPREPENQIPKEKVSATPVEDFVPPNDELADKICAQVEFYFSDENIVKDAFLLKHVKRNKEGYVSLKLISSFKRVKHLSRDWRVVGAALARSKKLEVNEQGTKLRRIDPLPPFDQTTPSRTVLAARLPVQRLSVESVAELFKPCGEIALIRVLRPGHPAPAEVRQAIAKRPDLASSNECAMIEFIDSASARMALQLSLGEAKIYALQQSADKKKKQQPPKKNPVARISREETYNSSSCASGSENEEGKSRHRRQMYNHPVYHVFAGGHPYQRKDKSIPNRVYCDNPESMIIPNDNHCSSAGSPSPEAWMPRRVSSCSMPGPENGLLLRRLSSCSGSGSDNGNFNRRFSSCSSSSENGYYHAVYPPGYYPQNRRFSCCSGSGSGSGSDCSGACFNPARRSSGDCGPFIRRLSACSRDSGYEVGTRRLSSCSSSSETGFFRPRSNSGIVVTHLPENITRLPSGPDGTRGFGRPPRIHPLATPMEPAC